MARSIRLARVVMGEVNMYSELGFPCLDEASRELLALRLRLSPYGWPKESDGARYDFARRLCPTKPRLRAGQALLLGADEGSKLGAAYLLKGVAEQTVANVRVATLGEAAYQAFEKALAAVALALPAHTLSRSSFDWPRAVHLQSAGEPGARLAGVGEMFSDGGSYGLPFALAIASRELGVPLPLNLAATGTVSEDGVVGPVAGLYEKLRVLLRLVDGPILFMVPKASLKQALLAKEWLDGLQRVQLLDVATVDEALALAFQVRLETKQVERVMSHPDGELVGATELSERLFIQALQGRHAAVYWSPVARLAGQVRRQLQDRLGLETSERLRFVEVVALRHEALFEFEKAEDWLPDAAWLNALFPEVRASVMAHVWQQAADQGGVEETVLEALQGSCGYAAGDVAPGTLKCMGARARYQAVTGSPDSALELCLKALKGWFDLCLPGEATYVVSAGYSLAGALRNQAGFDELDRCSLHAARLGVRWENNAFVRLARAAAIAQEKVETQSEVVNAARLELIRLVDGQSRMGKPALHEVPSDVRHSAARKLLTMERFAPEQRELWWRFLTARDKLAAGARSGKPEPRVGDSPSVYCTLAQIDEALSLGDEAGAEQLVDRLLAAQASGIANLVTAAQRLGKSRAAFVATFYPY